MAHNQEHIQTIIDALAAVCGSYGFSDYMPEAKIKLYARQSAPGSYEDGVFRSGQFYHWVRQEHPVPDYIFSRVFAQLRERLTPAGVEVVLPEGFNPAFDEVIKEYLRFDYDDKTAGRRELSDEFGGGEHAFGRAVERDLSARLGEAGETAEEIEVEVLVDDDSGPEVMTPWDDEADIPQAIVLSTGREADLIEEMKARMRPEVERELYTELGPMVHEEVRAQVELELRTELRAELMERMRGEVEAELQAQLEPALRRELYPLVHENLAAEIRLAERERIERDLGSELRDQVWEQLRAEVYDTVREEVKAELWRELRPVVEEQLSREYEEDELAAVLGTGDGREPHEITLDEGEGDTARDPHSVEFDGREEETAETADAGRASQGCHEGGESKEVEPAAAARPALRAEDQLKLIKIIREKLGPRIREQLVSDFEVIARAEKAKAEQEQRAQNLADPDYCHGRLQAWLFPDQPRLWDRVRPLIAVEEWAPVVRLLEDDATILDRERLSRSRPIMRETLKLKSDIESELAGLPPEPDAAKAERRLAGVQKMLTGADEILNFTLRSISAILETEDPRPRSR